MGGRYMQNMANVWRKSAWKLLREEHTDLRSTSLAKAVSVFPSPANRAILIQLIQLKVRVLVRYSESCGSLSL